jgi:5-dehydro-2-deoxygluconokinase
MSQATRPPELITIGRSSVDLYGQQIGGRLEDMTSFAKSLGGSPTNTATGAARLGLASGLITRVGADHMGRFIREQLVREGVDVHGVIDDPARLTALVLLGIRDRQNFPLIFYRENCADMALRTADLDRAWIASAGAVLINGTHLSQPNVFEVSTTAARWARDAGRRVIFDIDYRPVLWSLANRDMGEQRFVADAAVTARLQQVLPLCDLIVGTEEEIHILGGSTNTIEALRVIRSHSSALLVCKRGARGCIAIPGDIPARLDAAVVSPGFAVEVFNVLGAGDAFMAGFLRGWLRGEPIERCCEWANACGAIVVSRHGCAPAMPTWIELEQFLAMRNRPWRLREDTAFEQLHWSTTRPRVYDELMVLAIDHRHQFEDIAAQAGVAEGEMSARIGTFKSLAFDAIDEVAAGDASFGVLMDGRYGFDALVRAAERPYWIGRPIEVPKSRPLEFECSADVATELVEWPANHVVKCLVHYHPDDESELRARQERQLLRLFDACRKTQHELLIEVIAPSVMPIEVDTIALAMRRIYSLGVRPDWWKLAPATDPAAWRHIQTAIEECDPLCRGVLLLGLSVPEADLIRSFERAAPFGVVKGFAVGRTIFQDVAREWFAGRCTDVEAVVALAGKFRDLVTAWRTARSAAGRGASSAQ